MSNVSDLRNYGLTFIHKASKYLTTIDTLVLQIQF